MNTMTLEKQQQGIFRETSPLLLEALSKKNQAEEITFLLPTKYISEEAAKLGVLLDRLSNLRSHQKTIHRTFFAGCHWEALGGTIKLMRHHHWLQSGSSAAGRILIYDPSQELSDVFSPIKDEQDVKSLIPGLQFEYSFQAVADRIHRNEQFIGFICCWDGLTPIEEVDALFALCKTKKVWTAFDEGLLHDWYNERTRHVFRSSPDVFIVGENLATHTVPYASFTMTKEIFSPWESISTCLTHSSTYSGNTLSLSVVLSLFKEHGLTGPEEYISGNKKAKYQAYATYINPAVAWIFYGTHLSPDALKAQGCWITTSEGRLLDVIAGSGCCLRGHNPQDLVADVLDQHNPGHDYWADLSSRLSDLSGLPHALPAVSGALAVDMGMILSLLGNRPRKRIITFRYNYSGKLLISLSLTRFKYLQAPFAPLYFDVLEIDPFQEGACEELERELLSGEVALVWFEILQGQNLDMIPDKILDMINSNQERGGYYVGVDEVLTGMFRTGNFLCSSGKVLNPDLIALSKGLSDMVFPISCLLVSSRLYQSAKEANPHLVAKLDSYFINQMGAHIALHALTAAINMNLGQRVKEMGGLIKQSLQKTIKDSPLHLDIRGEGLLLYLRLNKKAFPINVLSEEFVEFLMSCYYLKRGRVLFLNSRMTPSLAISYAEVDFLCKQIARTVKRTNPLTLFFFCLRKVVYIHFLCAMQRVRERIWSFRGLR